MNITEIGRKAKEASQMIASSEKESRNNALTKLAKLIREKSSEIEKVNQKDIKVGQEKSLSEALLDRLLLSPERIESMAKSIEAIRDQEEVIGKIVEEKINDQGLKIQKVQIPLGVLGMIFESRPNVIIDCSALAIKSGNAIILKGGKEAANSNTFLGKLVQEALQNHLPLGTVQVLDSNNREVVHELLKLNQYVDLIIPRGGEGLIHFVSKESTIPVIAHFKGLCHIYIDESADSKKAIEIAMNAKTQRTGVCNAMETLLVHEKVQDKILKPLIKELLEQKVEVRGCPKTQALSDQVKPAHNDDWDTEYLDRILAIKVVDHLDDAIKHIQNHGSLHTEAIISENQTNIETFKRQVDASCIMVNASTRFNDGGELGLGAEIGISTTKFHAYGPMGASELTTRRFVVTGDGHIRK